MILNKRHNKKRHFIKKWKNIFIEQGNRLSQKETNKTIRLLRNSFKVEIKNLNISLKQRTKELENERESLNLEKERVLSLRAELENIRYESSQVLAKEKARYINSHMEEKISHANSVDNLTKIGSLVQCGINQTRNII